MPRSDRDFQPRGLFYTTHTLRDPELKNPLLA